MAGSCLEALLCTLSTASIIYAFFLYGDHIHEAYSKWDLTKLLYRGTKFTPFSDTNDLLITAIIPHALLMLMLICFSKSSLPSITTPRSFSSSVYANSWCVSPPSAYRNTLYYPFCPSASPCIFRGEISKVIYPTTQRGYLSHSEEFLDPLGFL